MRRHKGNREKGDLPNEQLVRSLVASGHVVAEAPAVLIRLEHGNVVSNLQAYSVSACIPGRITDHRRKVLAST